MGDGITISGGYSAAETDTLGRAAVALRSAAARLDDARLAAARARHALETIAAGPWSSAGAAWGTGAPVWPTRSWPVRPAGLVSVALDDVDTADGAVLRALAQLEELAVAVLRAAHLYEDHEALAVRVLDGVVPASVRLVAAGLVTLLPPLAGASGRPPVEVVAGAASRVLDAVAFLESGAGVRIEPVTLGTVDGVAGRPLPDLAAPGTVEGALLTLEVPNKAGDGVLAIQRLGAGDDARYVVLVPGTQEWNVWGDDAGDFANPRDLTSDLDLVGGRASAYTDEIAQAMQRVVPAGASVVVVGHSLGGIAAARLVASPALRRRYRFTGLVTAGAPSGGIAVPDDTLALNVENDREAVSALDPGANPPGPRHVVVHASGANDVVRDALGGRPVGGATHGLAVHAAVLGEARARHDPALDRALSELDASLAGPATATWYFRGERGGAAVVGPDRAGEVSGDARPGPPR